MDDRHLVQVDGPVLENEKRPPPEVSPAAA